MSFQFNATFIWRRLAALLLAAQSVLAQSPNKAAPVHQVDGSFVRDWLVLGPFPGREVEVDFLAPTGGEAKVRPKEGDTIVTKEGKTLVWTRLHSKHDIVNLEQTLGIQDWIIAYVYCDLKSDQAVETDVRAGLNYNGVLWVNGSRVGGQTVWNLADRGEIPPVMPIKLETGSNHCLLKLRSEPFRSLAFSFQPLPPTRATMEFGVVDAQGRGAGGASVQIFEKGELVARVLADSSGKAKASLYPFAEVYDLKVTSAELGNWLYNVRPRGGERSVINVALTNALSISGHVLAMDGSPQNAIVVQALRISGEEGRAASTTRDGEAEKARTNHVGPGQLPLIPSLLPTPPFSETVLTDGSGAFHFVNLRPGTYQIRAHGLSGYVYPDNAPELAASKKIAVRPGGIPQDITILCPMAKHGVWSKLPIKKGLVELNTRSVHRTPDGELWVGSDHATVHEYDGTRFKIYSAPEIPGNSITFINHDTNGTLWIGSNNGVSRKNSESIQTLPFVASLPRKVVQAMEMDADGTKWFATGSGLARYDGGKAAFLGAQDGLPSSGVDSDIRTKDGALWLGCWEGVARLDGKNITEPLPLLKASKIYQAKDGAIWLCAINTHAGVYRYDERGLFHLGSEDGLRGEYAFDIAETSDGVMWFGMDKGLSRFDGKTIRNYTEPDGLTYAEVKGIFVDSDDVLWCTTLAGVFRFDAKGFEGIKARDGMKIAQGGESGVFVIQPDLAGGYLIGTGWGGVFRTSGKEPLTATQVYPAAYIRQICRGTNNALWFAQSDGIHKEANGGLTNVLSREWIIALNVDNQGNLWFGHGWVGGGVTRYNPITREETVFDRGQGLPDDQVWDIKERAEGGMWIGTSEGLALIRDGKIENVSKRLGLPAAGVFNLRQDAEGVLWMGSSRGLHRLIPAAKTGGKGEQLISITASNGLPDQHIWCSGRTSDGIIWMGTDNNGLVGYDGQAVTAIDQRDGLVGNQIFTLQPEEDGSLLFGCLDGGVGRFRPTKSAPSARLAGLRVEGRTFTNYSNIPEAEIGRAIDIEYQEIDLKTHPDKRQFRYSVRGPSGETLFGGITKDRRFGWTPKKGGAYTFEVQVIDRDLNYSKPAQVTVRAFVPWYANAWILAPGGAGFGGLVIWAFVARALYTRKTREAARLREQMLQQERRAREALEESNRSLVVAKESAEAAKLEADVANRAKSTFLANMSHEIRTPLNAILGFAQILRRKTGLAADDREAVEIIESSGDHLLSLINHVLDLSKIEAGAMELSESDFDLRYMVLGLSALFEPRCQEKGLRFEMEWKLKSNPPSESEEANGPVPIHGDEGKLRQVLINLLGNAVKFTEVGQVTLRVTCDSSDRVSNYRFEVADTGPGIPSEVQEKLFAPFVQAGEGLQKGGTGLGLAISKRLVQLMGGTIGVNSTKEGGSCFYFTVPLAAADQAAIEAHAGDAMEPRRLAEGHKVDALIVDDVEQNRTVLFQLLTSLGCQTRVADSGERALEFIRSRIPGIVLTDIRMPGMSGFELKDKIIEEFGRGRVKIVAISASVLAHEQKHCLESGFDDFIGKPFRVARLGDCLRRLLSIEFEYTSNAQAIDREELPRVRLPEALLTRLKNSAKAYRMVEFKRCLAEVEQLGSDGRRLAAELNVLNQKGEVEEILAILEKMA